jgi:hypothetical protein
MNELAHSPDDHEMPRARRIVWVLWPAFLMAAVLEILLFACWDPLDLHWFGRSVELSRDTVYSMSFFVLWGASSLSAWLTLILCEGWQSATHGVAPNGDPVNVHGSSERPGP